jgi:hypothetical protein
MGTLNMLLSARIPEWTQTLSFLFCWWQEAFFPTEHGGPALPTVPDRERALSPPSESENARFPTEGRKTITCYSSGSTRSPFPPRYTEAQCFTLHLPTEESCLSCPRSGVPAPPVSGNLLHRWCYEAWPPYGAQRLHALYCDCMRAPVPPSNSSSLIEGRKEVIWWEPCKG